MSPTATTHTKDQKTMLGRHAELCAQYATATAGIKAGLSRTKIPTLEYEMYTSGLRPKDDDGNGDYVPFKVPPKYTTKYADTPDEVITALELAVTTKADENAPDSVRSYADQKIGQLVEQITRRQLDNMLTDELRSVYAERIATATTGNGSK